jgi:2Fe-2S ferredoxin
MPRVRFPKEGLEVVVEPGTTLLEAAHQAGAKVGFACGGNCACSTCHVWVVEGLDSLSDVEEAEDDIMDKAFDVKPESRLSCQAVLGDDDVDVEITPESRKAWYDEHPEERRKAAAQR